jgi:hypothetical protein
VGGEENAPRREVRDVVSELSRRGRYR